MLDFFRTKAKGIFAWVILVLISFVFILWGVKGIGITDNDKVLVKINGTKIYRSKIDAMIKNYSYYSQKELNKEEKDKLALKITEDMSRSILVNQFLKKANFVATDNQILLFFRSVTSFKDDAGKFSPEKFQAFLAQEKISEKEYIEQLKTFLIANQLENGLMNSEMVFDYEIKQSSDIYDQLRDIGYVEVNRNSIKLISASIQELEDFYNKNKDHYKTADLFDVERIYLDFSKTAEEIVVSTDRAKDYYYNNLSDFTEEERWNLSYISIAAQSNSDQDKSGEAEAAINDIHAKLKLGQSFVNVSNSAMKEYDADTGKLGWIAKNSEFPEQVFLLKKAGEISDVIKLDSGYYIFKLEDKREYKQKPFDEVVNIIKSRITVEESEEIIHSKMEELEHSLSSNIMFEDLAKDLALSYDKSNSVSINELLGKYKNQEDAQAIIAKDFAGVSQKDFSSTSKFIEIDRRNAVAIRIVKHYQGEVIPFNKVQTKVLADYNDKMINEKIIEKTTSIWKEINSGITPNQACKNHNLVWTNMRAIPRQSLIKSSDQLKELAFSLPNPKYAVVGKNYAAYRLNKNGTGVVVSVANVYSGGLSANLNNSDMKAKFYHEILNGNLRLSLELWVETLKTDANIKNYFNTSEKFA